MVCTACRTSLGRFQRPTDNWNWRTGWFSSGEWIEHGIGGARAIWPNGASTGGVGTGNVGTGGVSTGRIGTE